MRFEAFEDGLGEDLAGSAKQGNASIVIADGAATLLIQWD